MRRIGVLDVPRRAGCRVRRPRLRRFRQTAAGARLDRRPKSADRLPLGRRQSRHACANTRRNWSRSRRTSSWPRAASMWAAAAGHPHRADRVRPGRRPGRRRLCGEPGAPGRQRHRLQPVRIRHQRQMAGAARRSHRASCARRCSAIPAIAAAPRSSAPFRRWGRARRGSDPDRPARRRGDRARHRRVRATVEWRPDHHANRARSFIASSIIALAARHRLPAVYPFASSSPRAA